MGDTGSRRLQNGRWSVMTSEEIRILLEHVADGSVSPDEAIGRLKDGPLRQDELDFATLDHHRHLRQGLAEVVYGEGKTVEEITG